MDLSLRAQVTGRETRRFARYEVAECRAVDGDAGGFTLDGYASLFDTPYTVRDFLGEFTEEIAPGAFTRTLRQQDDVRLLVNHEGIPLARTKSGTLELDEDATGLHSLAPALDPANPTVQELASAMRRGDVDQMSFAFEVRSQVWSPDYTHRRITEVKLWDVSVVTYPANDATSVGLRSDGVLDLARIDALVAEARAGKVLSAANEQTLRDALDAIDTARGSIEGVLAAAKPAEENGGIPLGLALRRLELLSL
jgi:HK97 family phage prohead protease